MVRRVAPGEHAVVGRRRCPPHTGAATSGSARTPIGAAAGPYYFLLGYTELSVQPSQAKLWLIQQDGAGGPTLRVSDVTLGGAYPQLAYDAGTQRFGVTWLGRTGPGGLDGGVNGPFQVMFGSVSCP